MNLRGNSIAVAFLALILFPAMASAHRDSPPNLIAVAPDTLESSSPTDLPEHINIISMEKSGTLPTTEGMLLQLKANPGNVHIFTDATSSVSYRVRVEADSGVTGAEHFLSQFTIGIHKTRRGVSIEGTAPWRRFQGPFSVHYEIHVPRRSSLEVHSMRGNIALQDIEGRIDLSTDGGNITAGLVNSDNVAAPQSGAKQIAAKLDTKGGHISIGDVSGALQASTSGGHITTGNIDGEAVIRTGGGQIRTGKISGSATLDTGGGNITTWLDETPINQNFDSSRSGRPSDATELRSGEGDIFVYFPREMAASIDAVIRPSGGHRIIADTSLPLAIGDESSSNDLSAIHFTGNLNGGGRVVRLDAESGNIHLKSAEPRTAWRAVSPASRRESRKDSISNFDGMDNVDVTEGFFGEMRRRILESVWGGIPVDSEEMQKHLAQSVAPTYPDVARTAGIEGDVVLRVYVSSDGRITNLKVLDGPPILARAAVEAVQQWKYQPLRWNGRPFNAITTLVVSFRLH